MAGRPVLLEIGVEEIPARFLPGAMKDMKGLAGTVLGEAGVGYGEIRAFATPRRLVLIIEGVPLRQEDRVREVFGPPRQAAYSEDGSFTKAALGFARSQGVGPERLVIRKKGKGDYLAAIMEEKGLPLKELLPGLLKKIILALNFPRSMRWGDGEMRFARPIHWVLALFGENTVRFELDGIKSANRSRGHRFLSPGEFAVKRPGDYIEELRGRNVVVEPEKRMEAIREQALELAAGVSGLPAYDDELLCTVAFLVEQPVCVLGSFSEKYLELPDELLTAVMVGHQKYLPVKDSGGRLMNSFVVVSNTRSENADMVKAGAERVIRSRFEDARFYFKEDSKRTLSERLEGLKQVTFQERLGSLYEKTMRVRALAGALALGICPRKEAEAVRAAELSKADLVTGVVREFPELQGIMGMYYARRDGEEQEVSTAIREQYLPAFSGDRAPATDVGTVLSLAERVDNMVSFFSIGLKPTGSEDPFALRRQALGVIAILIERGIESSLRELLRPALAGLSGDGAEVEAEVLRFFGQRLEILLGARGYGHDLVQSVMARSTDIPLREVLKRLEALKWFKSHAAYNDFLVAIKRVKNIIPPGELPPANDALFKVEEERALHAGLGGVRAGVEAGVDGSDYTGALAELLRLREPINAFFDKVLVMDRDGETRRNRLALLNEVCGAALLVADFSRLEEEARPLS